MAAISHPNIILSNRISANTGTFSLSETFSPFTSFLMTTAPNRWTDAEDNLLRELINQFGKQWSVIASRIPNRTPTQVAARWEKCINPALTKGQFTSEEDQLIRDYVNDHGIHAWPKIITVLPHRSSKQCRERWFNSLDPEITKAPWTAEEDRLIFEAYVSNGPKWSQIARMISGRSDNAVKNRWNASISKRFVIGEDGQPQLSGNRVRKYTRKNQIRPPPIIAPEVAPIANDPPVAVLTPSLFTPRGWFTGFGESVLDLDGFEPLRIRTPLASPAFPTGIALFSPTGLGHDF
jgi:hypothetical protein